MRLWKADKAAKDLAALDEALAFAARTLHTCTDPKRQTAIQAHVDQLLEERLQLTEANKLEAAWAGSS